MEFDLKMIRLDGVEILLFDHINTYRWRFRNCWIMLVHQLTRTIKKLLRI